MITSLKVQFKLGKDNYSISLVNGVPTYWALTSNKKLGRFVASKVQDAPTVKKLEKVYAQMLKAVAN